MWKRVGLYQRTMLTFSRSIRAEKKISPRKQTTFSYSVLMHPTFARKMSSCSLIHPGAPLFSFVMFSLPFPHVLSGGCSENEFPSDWLWATYPEINRDRPRSIPRIIFLFICRSDNSIYLFPSFSWQFVLGKQSTPPSGLFHFRIFVRNEFYSAK